MSRGCTLRTRERGPLTDRNPKETILAVTDVGLYINFALHAIYGKLAEADANRFAPSPIVWSPPFRSSCDGQRGLTS